MINLPVSKTPALASEAGGERFALFELLVIIAIIAIWRRIGPDHP